jgi:hypothetical protein
MVIQKAHERIGLPDQLKPKAYVGKAGIQYTGDQNENK